jgi:hypothetical protein
MAATSIAGRERKRNGTLDHLRVVDMFVGFFLHFFKANICGGFRVENGVFFHLPLDGTSKIK